MKLKNKIALGISVAAVAGIVFCFARRTSLNSNRKQMLSQVADEGYETAHDILFPDQEIKSMNVHYGPVIPK
ncbi:hypothetical protein BH11BAC3_BH11BAC3_23400 [soil metagenome]